MLGVCVCVCVCVCFKRESDRDSLFETNQHYNKHSYCKPYVDETCWAPTWSERATWTCCLNIANSNIRHNYYDMMLICVC